MKKPIFRAMAAALLLGTLPAAHAVPTLSFSVDLGAPTTCADGAACDSNATVGAVTFVGTLGGGVFSVNVTTGITKPVFTDGTPLMDLNSVNVQSGAGSHTLLILFSETGFDHSGQFSGLVGGTLSGAGASVTADVYFDAGNALFVPTTLAGSMGPFGLGAFSDSFVGAFAPAAPYSVTQAFLLTTTGDTTFSADFEVSVPEPTTLALLGLGFAFAGFWSRRRQQLA